MEVLSLGLTRRRPSTGLADTLRQQRRQQYRRNGQQIWKWSLPHSTESEVATTILPKTDWSAQSAQLCPQSE